MKVIKKNTPAVKTLKEQFAVGETITWTVSFFDGRTTTYDKYTGKVVKVNKVTVDVQCLDNGDIVRLDADDLARVRR